MSIDCSGTLPISVSGRAASSAAHGCRQEDTSSASDEVGPAQGIRHVSESTGGGHSSAIKLNSEAGGIRRVEDLRKGDIDTGHFLLRSLCPYLVRSVGTHE